MRGRWRTKGVLRWAAALGAGVIAGAACSGSLVDHSAGAAVLYPNGCPAGQVLCGAACVAEDALHCGSSCSSCVSSVPPDTNAGPVCTETHQCSFACNPGWLRVGSACERAVAVSGGFAHTCAVTAASGKVKCWGANEHGQLGDGSTTDSAIPVDVSLPAAATAIAAGYVHTCAIAGGSVYCWGDNTTGSLGDGSPLPAAPSSTPVKVASPLPSGATAIAAGGGENAGTPPSWYGHSCAVVGGSIWCWGSNESGQLGDGSSLGPPTPPPSPTPVKVALGSLDGQATAVSNGDRHSCAIVQGSVRCWGAAGSWQLGNGNTSNQSNPVSAPLQPSGAAPLAIVAGAAHTCAAAGTTPSPTIQCWGSNSSGQAAGGDNSSLTVQQPTAVPADRLPAGFATSSAAAGNAHTCALDGTTGAVTCFGADDASQLSGPPTARGNVQVPLPAGAQAVGAGYNHSCALLRDGGIVCWGANGWGQLGNGSISASSAGPAFVSGR